MSHAPRRAAIVSPLRTPVGKFLAGFGNRTDDRGALDGLQLLQL